MLNTVPRDVSLTDEITLLPAKVWGAQLTIEHNQLVYKTNLRVRAQLCYIPSSYFNLSI